MSRALAFAGARGHPRRRRRLLVRVEAGGIQVLQVGAWPAPFGITLVADVFSALLVVMVGIIGMVVTGHSFSGVDPRREAFGYHALVHVLLMGVSGAFLTGDIFNLYVWFEVMLIASFVLMALYRTHAQLQAAFTYVTLNLLASALLLTAIGLLYGQAGTLNFADLARAWPERQTPGARHGARDAVPHRVRHQGRAVSAVLLAAGVVSHAARRRRRPVRRPADEGRRLRADPRLHPAVPQQPRAACTRSSSCSRSSPWWSGWSPPSASGTSGACCRSISSGTSASRPWGWRCRRRSPSPRSIFYMLHHIVVITNLFLVSGLFLRLRRTTDLAALGGLYRTHPAAAVLAMIPVFSLAGDSPALGFRRQAGDRRGVASTLGYYRLAAVALAVSLLTLLSMARLWSEAFWKPAPAGATDGADRPAMLAPIAALAIVTLGLTFAAEPVFSLCRRARRTTAAAGRVHSRRSGEWIDDAARQHSARAGLGRASGRILAGQSRHRVAARLPGAPVPREGRRAGAVHATSASCISPSAWPGSSCGSSSSRTCGWPWTSPRRGIT